MSQLSIPAGARQRSSDPSVRLKVAAIIVLVALALSTPIMSGSTVRTISTAISTTVSSVVSQLSSAPTAASGEARQGTAVQGGGTSTSTVADAQKRIPVKPIIDWVKSNAPKIWNAMVSAVKAGYSAFKKWFASLAGWIQAGIKWVAGGGVWEIFDALWHYFF